MHAQVLSVCARNQITRVGDLRELNVLPRYLLAGIPYRLRKSCFPEHTFPQKPSSRNPGHFFLIDYKLEKNGWKIYYLKKNTTYKKVIILKIGEYRQL